MVGVPGRQELYKVRKEVWLGLGRVRAPLKGLELGKTKHSPPPPLLKNKLKYKLQNI